MPSAATSCWTLAARPLPAPADTCELSAAGDAPPEAAARGALGLARRRDARPRRLHRGTAPAHHPPARRRGLPLRRGHRRPPGGQPRRGLEGPAQGRRGTWAWRSIAVRGRGYRLAAPLELLDPERILAALAAEAQPRIARLEIHDADRLHQRPPDGARPPPGRPAGPPVPGRAPDRRARPAGRTWVSPFGANLYLSLLWRYPLRPRRAGRPEPGRRGRGRRRPARRRGPATSGSSGPTTCSGRGASSAACCWRWPARPRVPAIWWSGLGINLRMDPDQGRAIDQPWVDLRPGPGGPPTGPQRPGRRLIAALFAALERFGQLGLEPFLADWEHLRRTARRAGAAAPGRAGDRGDLPGSRPGRRPAPDHGGGRPDLPCGGGQSASAGGTRPLNLLIDIGNTNLRWVLPGGPGPGGPLGPSATMGAYPST